MISVDVLINEPMTVATYSWDVVGIMHCNYDVSYVYSLSLNSLLLDFHFCQ